MKKGEEGKELAGTKGVQREGRLFPAEREAHLAEEVACETGSQRTASRGEATSWAKAQRGETLVHLWDWEVRSAWLEHRLRAGEQWKPGWKSRVGACGSIVTILILTAFPETSFQITCQRPGTLLGVGDTHEYHTRFLPLRSLRPH